MFEMLLFCYWQTHNLGLQLHDRVSTWLDISPRDTHGHPPGKHPRALARNEYPCIVYRMMSPPPKTFHDHLAIKLDDACNWTFKRRANSTPSFQHNMIHHRQLIFRLYNSHHQLSRIIIQRSYTSKQNPTSDNTNLNTSKSDPKMSVPGMDAGAQPGLVSGHTQYVKGVAEVSYYIEISPCDHLNMS